ncbi:MAG TPA: hypothetical protein VI564_07400 [Candidatus Nanoarchaeia archaeon]|nr:hypothetical protein [Candidatus Nanoarchaeia archaeon]
MNKKSMGFSEMIVIAIVLFFIVFGMFFSSNISKLIKDALGITKNEVVESADPDLLWNNVLVDYQKHRCDVDASSCKASSFPCLCFSAKEKELKQRPDQCSPEKPYCYDGFIGCSNTLPVQHNLENCADLKKNIGQASSECQTDKFSCNVKNGPCICYEGKDNGQYCDTGYRCYNHNAGCKKSDDLHFYYPGFSVPKDSNKNKLYTEALAACSISNNFLIEKLPVCNTDGPGSCVILNYPCRCVVEDTRLPGDTVGRVSYQVCESELSHSRCFEKFGCLTEDQYKNWAQKWPICGKT